MLIAATGRVETKLGEVRDIVSGRLEGAEAEAYLAALEIFYASASQDDVEETDAEELYGASLALWKFCLQRPPGRARVRVYTPRMAEHGWQCSHTILEIVNDDMPFLVDSVTMLLTDRGHGIHGLIHPVITVARDGEGRFLRFADPGEEGAVRESVIQVMIDQVGDAKAHQSLEADVAAMLADVTVAVADWRAMLSRLSGVAEELKRTHPAEAEPVMGESVEFLDWVAANHFTFLGYRPFVVDRERNAFRMIGDAGLGLMRDPDYTVMRDLEGNFIHWSPELSDVTGDPMPLLIIKANRRSNIHRPAHFDVLAVKEYDAEGRLACEHVFIGLFTSAAYNRSPREIPLLRNKVRRVIDRAGYIPSSHDGKALINVLETYPRDELFQATDDELYENALGVLHLNVRPRTRLFLRHDRFCRFVSCIVFVPRERYNTELRVKLGNILCEALDGRVASWEPSFGVELMARVHYVIAMRSGRIPDYDAGAIEQEIVQAVRSWSDRLLEALVERWGEHRGHKLHQRFGAGFSASYREEVRVDSAVADIEKMIPLGDDQPLALHFYRRLEDREDAVRFKLYRWGGHVPLSDCLPVLENMGFRILDEHPYRIELGETDLWIHDFHMLARGGRPVDLTTLRQKLEDAFGAAWDGTVDDDALNRLVLVAGLGHREVALLRAYSRFLRQTRVSYSVAYMEDALAENPGIARLLTALFAAKFDPSTGLDREARQVAADGLSAEIETALEQVPSLDVDQILRRFRNAIEATLRTNYYQPAADGTPKPYVSFKFDSEKLEDLPLPRPWREIFVHASWVEGVHLRGGPVARGGIRWSDRKEDYRTEILGLVKAQQVKNAVIVPVGSKGGFLPKKLPAGGGREEVQQEAIRCYRTFLSGLLDITDNLVEGEVVPPRDVVRHDDDDPYLVVAADKGTATFSDIANALSRDYGFWLDDAFASGGSNGYDHKAMGITARGAWEAVKRHFRELGRDIQTEPFDVIGIGDMSGDVFGNGMLLSRSTRLVAAFDHRDIFIDPDPDPERSFGERKRLFETPRTTWRDYDASLISTGGGVFPRSAKAIALTPEIRRLTGIKAERATPHELMKALLKAETDLLWFGGIGTYVKASDEAQAEAGDRTNDPIRVDGDEVRAKVIGEGANLGVTQRGRIELARHGVKLNTDAVDNSAGVDCSDHEVNIKIALGAVVQAGDMTEKQRNRLLAAMTDEVAELVLETNYNQTLALSMVEARAPQLLDEHARFMRGLEARGELNREVELLPNDEAIAELRARGLGLTRPEIAVIVSYAKIRLFGHIVASPLPDDPYVERLLIGYMPTPLREAHRDAILGHRLRREIIATVVANAIVNEAGPTLVNRTADETGASYGEIAEAFVAARDILGVEVIRDGINALDNRVAAGVQTRMHLALHDAISSLGHCLLKRPSDLNAGQLIDLYKPGVTEVAGRVGDFLSDYLMGRFSELSGALTGAGVPEELARRVSGLEFLGGALDIVDVATQRGRSVGEVADTYFAAGARFGLDWLRTVARGLEPSDHWERVALGRLVSDLRSQQSLIAASALDVADGAAGDGAVEAWAERAGEAVSRAERLVAELREGQPLTVSKLAVASSQFQSISG